MIKAIIFDFFGVICNEVMIEWFGGYFDPKESREIKDKYFKKVDAGTLTENELVEDLSNLIHIPAGEIRKEWQETIQINWAVVKIIDQLKKNYKIGLCSNSASTFIRPILTNNNLERLFDSIIISSEIGSIKPEIEIYRLTLKDLGVEPKEVIFIDDNPENLNPAKEMGMKNILFKSSQLLSEDLNHLMHS